MRYATWFVAVMFASSGLGVIRASADLTYSPLAVDADLRVLVVSGEISRDEPLEKFASAIAENNATLVAFDSSGGNVASAMALGRMIRLLGLNTLQVRRLECASACSLAFLGGVTRIAEPGSIGVHRTSFAPNAPINRDDAVAGVQALTADIISYLTEMGVSTDLLGFSLRYDQADIRYLSASEMQQLRVTTEEIASLPPTTRDETATSEPTGSTVEDAAVGIVRQLIERHGTDTVAAMQAVASLYANPVSYYGKQRALEEVLTDKRNYFQRWPERAYRIREQTLMVTCANGMCMVSGTYDWVVRSLPRNKQAQGAATFSYTISLGNSPKIVSETGSVVKQ